MRMTLSEIVAVVQGSTLTGGQLSGEATGVSTDTRTLQAGDLFVALSGESFDGHAYVANAFDKGAVAAIVSSARLDELTNSGLLIGVADPLISFGKIALAWRRKFDVPVVAVTGSVGKTTTKEMLAATLSPLGPVLKTEKNENNEIGVPQLLLRLTA